MLILTITTVVALAGPVVEGRDRAAEQTVRAFLEASERREIESALGYLAPGEREAWRIFVQHQAGDQFRVLSIAVRRPPLLTRIDAWRQATSVTIVAEIRGKGGEQWRDTTLVNVTLQNGLWLMETPPFAPGEPWLVPPDA